MRIADFELPRGSIAIERLMAMPRADWEHLRREINLRRRGDPSNPLARCRLCEGGVLIRAQAVQGGHVPLFAHFPDAPASCAWYEGGTIAPDAARAAQYRGHQESALHRYLCRTLEAVAKADSRCVESAVNTYLRPAIQERRGRWPDVYLDFGELGRFALEVQLSKPFAPEIADRHLYYGREGIGLIWVFSGIAEPLPQGFHDVITMQRGNAFVFDDEALAASLANATVMLKCYLEDGRGAYLKPRLVGLHELDRSNGIAVFLEDRRTERLIAYCREARGRWWSALRSAHREKPASPFYSDCFEPAWASLRAQFPELSSWKEDYWATHADKGRAHLASLFAILCSTAHSAEIGSDTVYITRHAGSGALLAMLNSKLGSSTYGSYADLLDHFLDATPLSELLQRPSLMKTLMEARRSHVQIGPDHPVWRAARRMFPEALDGMVRAELADLDRLPGWARRGGRRP